MRILLTMSTLLLISSFAQAQDDATAQAMQAAQQAAQQSQQAALQAMQQASEANQQASQAMQQAMQNAMDSQTSPVCCPIASTPKFSVKAGTYSSPTSVRITDATRGAIIYYSTDGWTPTASSKRYMGPISITSTTTLRAIALVPGLGRSFVASAQYTFKSPLAVSSSPAQSASSTGAPAIPVDGKLALPQGTPVQLVFAADVSSQKAAVGDQISLTLSDDLKLGDTVLVKKGAPAVGTVIQVDKSGAGGLPGVLAFQVDSLNLDGTLIPLSGTASTEGDAKPPNAAVLIPVVGPFTVFKHGTDAIIKQGTPFTAYLAADTSLMPAE